MYIILISLFLLSMCSPKMQKSTSEEKTPLLNQEKMNYSSLEISAREIKNKQSTLGGIIRKFTVDVKKLPSSESYKILWYERVKGKSNSSFINSGKEYTQVLGGANPGPNAVYGSKVISAIVEFSDGTKSKEIKVLTHQYLIKPGFDNDVKMKRLNE